MWSKFLSVIPTFVARFRRNSVQEGFLKIILAFLWAPKWSVHKSTDVKFPRRDYSLCGGLSEELVSCHLSGDWNFEVVSRHFEKIFPPPISRIFSNSFPEKGIFLEEIFSCFTYLETNSEFSNISYAKFQHYFFQVQRHVLLIPLNIIYIDCREIWLWILYNNII